MKPNKPLLLCTIIGTLLIIKAAIYRFVMIQNIRKVLDVIFYMELSGKEPVREWLFELDKQDRRKIGRDILSVQYQWPIGMPLVKPISKGLWEIRTSLDNRIARIFFMIHGKEMVLLHGIIKKTQKTPPSEIALAKKRASSFLTKEKGKR